jgi:hypothetical protein
MGVNSIPLRWPATWGDPGMLGLLQAAPVRQLIIDRGLADQAKQAGLTVIDPQALPSDVTAVKGPWPGIRASHGGGDRAAAGPTGEPWVDSNGWRIRVARAQRPEARIWVDSKPQPSRSSAADYAVAFADAAAHGGSWIITLDDALAAAIAAKKPEALQTWKRIMDAAAFFGEPNAATYNDEAVIGVLSTFGESQVGFTHEVFNNLARTKQQYRAIAAGRMTPGSLAGLKGLIYTGPGEPPSGVRTQVLDFVNSGGMLITGPAWGSLPKGTPQQQSHPRFAMRELGKGSIAVATANFTDPYRVPNDAVVLVSHRHDIVRFFNSGAITPCLSAAADKRRAVLQTVFYSLRPVEDTSVWVKGSFRAARIRAWNQTQPQDIKLAPRDAGVEIHLPAVAQYAMIELES